MVSKVQLVQPVLQTARLARPVQPEQLVKVLTLKARLQLFKICQFQEMLRAMLTSLRLMAICMFGQVQLGLMPVLLLAQQALQDLLVQLVHKELRALSALQARQGQSA